MRFWAARITVAASGICLLLDHVHAHSAALIAEAISPVWEANHVWLILVIVILFTAFPPAFAAIATALHIPDHAVAYRNRSAWHGVHVSHV